jgi:Tfp pilus assembly protein PilN
MFSWRPIQQQQAPDSLSVLGLTFTRPEIVVMRWLQVGMLVTIMVSLAMSAWLWQGSLDQERAAERIEAAAAKLQAASGQLTHDLAQEGLTLKAAQLGDLKREIIFANHVSAKRDLSWARLLSDLEEATPAHVSYSSVQLNYKEATVTLQGATASLSDLNALVAAVDAHQAFGNATLSSHALEAAKDEKGEVASHDSAGLPNVKQVLFDMTATYRPLLKGREHGVH